MTFVVIAIRLSLVPADGGGFCQIFFLLAMVLELGYRFVFLHLLLRIRYSSPAVLRTNVTIWVRCSQRWKLSIGLFLTSSLTLALFMQYTYMSPYTPFTRSNKHRAIIEQTSSNCIQNTRARRML